MISVLSTVLAIAFVVAVVAYFFRAAVVLQDIRDALPDKSVERNNAAELCAAMGIQALILAICGIVFVIAVLVSIGPPRSRDAPTTTAASTPSVTTAETPK